MTDALRIALVVPDYRYEWDDERHCRVESLRAACKQGSVDLVVFPEAYERQQTKADDLADGWAHHLSVPTIVGIETNQGFQTAAYRNPNAGRGETARHVYVKHSTADRLAYEWPGYREMREAMFAPIVLKNRRLAVQICHDMFYGLIGQRQKSSGAEVFVDISGGGVNYRKWSNIVLGRSLELEAPFLCTMAKRPGENGVARALAFANGVQVRAVSRNVGGEGFGGYSVFEVPPVASSAREADAEVTEDQQYTDKLYDDITVTTGRDHDAAIVVDPVTGVLRVPPPVRTLGSWTGFESAVGRVGVLLLGLDRLSDGRALYEVAPPRGAFDHHVVVYFASTPEGSLSSILALARLRAIEHRVGVVVVAGEYREALKTNRYKNIQRFREVDGVFGFNAEFLGGTWSTAGTSSRLGIPEQYFTDYLDLLDGSSASR